MPTLKEYRQLAKNIGLKGYSRLNKTDLMLLIARKAGIGFEPEPITNKPKRKTSRKPKRKTSRKPKRSTSRKVSNIRKIRVLSKQTGKMTTISIKEVAPKARYKALTNTEADELLNETGVNDASDRKMIKEELKKLSKKKIPKDFISQYFTPYEKMVKNAYTNYAAELIEIVRYIKDIEDEVKEMGGTYSKKERIDDIQYYYGEADRRLKRNLMVAKSYINNFDNYARALIYEWKENGGSDFP